MVMSYFLAQMMCWSTDDGEAPGWGSLLVLGSANVDEALRGWVPLTTRCMYDM